MSMINELEKIYQKNILYFQKFFPDLYLKLAHFTEDNKYELIVDKRGYFNIQNSENGIKLYNDNPELIAQNQVNSLLKTSQNLKKVVFTGTLLGFQIEKLILKADLRCIMIIEPNLELFRLSTFIIDYETLTKNKFITFCINDSHEVIKDKFLEFFYTLFFHNKEISFLNVHNEYHPILNDLHLILKSNVYSNDILNIKKIPPLKSNVDVIPLFDMAHKQKEKHNYKKAIEYYLSIIQIEQVIKTKNVSEKVLERIYASYYNLGNIFQNLRYETEAYHCYGKCIYGENSPISIQQKALYHYGIMYKNNGKNLFEMVDFIKNHLTKYGRNVMLALLLSQYLFDMNKYKEAEELLSSYHQELLDNKMLDALIPSVPIVYNSQEEIDIFRKNLEESIDALMDIDISIPENNLSLINTFYLAFHNRNNKTLLSKLSSLYEKVTPSLLYASKHCHNYKYTNKRIKLGIINNFLRENHPVLKFMKNIIDYFTKSSEYELYIFTFSKDTDKIFSKNVHLLPSSLKEQRNTIAKQKLDIIIYPEIGMHSLTYFLAHARLAPIQCMLSGHPVTSGIKNMDYYFSTKILESESAKDYYTEKLILFDYPLASYQKPTFPQEFMSKNELSLSDNKHNYLIPTKLQKIHPHFDKLLLNIAQKDKNALFILFKDKSSNKWDNYIKERLLQTLDKTHIEVRPWSDFDTFYSLLHHSDAVLEPTVFGYGTTAIEAFSIGTPIITLPGTYNSGRATSLFYNLMNFTTLIASNENDYADKAIKLAKDTSLRELYRNKILASNAILYNNNGSIKELDTFLSQKLMQYK